MSNGVDGGSPLVPIMKVVIRKGVIFECVVYEVVVGVEGWQVGGAVFDVSDSLIVERNNMLDLGV